jgi:hypothetical protein
VIAGAIFLSFAYADRVQGLLGQGGTDIAVRLSAFILFCLGLQILWSGCSELLRPYSATEGIATPQRRLARKGLWLVRRASKPASP